MKMRLLWMSLSTLLWFGSVDAEGLNLSWDNCGVNGAEFRTFACNTNAGQSVLVGSIVAPDSLESVVSVDAYVDFKFSNFVVPDWWQLWNPGSCRQTSALADGTTLGLTGCLDHWQGHAVVFIGRYVINGGGIMRMGIGVSLASAYARAWTEGTEVFVFRVVFDHLKTVGADVCGGCEGGADVTFVYANVENTGSPQRFVVRGPASRNVARWNGGFTPALNTSWGAIKALYR